MIEISTKIQLTKLNPLSVVLMSHYRTRRDVSPRRIFKSYSSSPKINRYLRYNGSRTISSCRIYNYRTRIISWFHQATIEFAYCFPNYGGFFYAASLMTLGLTLDHTIHKLLVRQTQLKRFFFQIKRFIVVYNRNVFGSFFNRLVRFIFPVTHSERFNRK